jgi:hypothetical protein
MAKNLNLKLNNLKISTGVESLYENKSALNGNIKRTGQTNNINASSSISPKKGYNSNHTPSLSIGNNSTANSNNSRYIGGADIMKGQRSNSKSGYHSNNMNSNSNNQSNYLNSLQTNYNSNNSAYNSNNFHSKSKNEIDVDNNFFHMPNTFSPKSTKTNITKGGNTIAIPVPSNNHKFVPLSTRANTGIPSHTYTNKSINSNNYYSNGPSNSQIDLNSVNSNNTNAEVINVMSLLGSQNNVPISLKNLNASIPNYEISKFSVKSMPVIKAYAANTHQGIIRYVTKL